MLSAFITCFTDITRHMLDDLLFSCCGSGLTKYMKNRTYLGAVFYFTNSVTVRNVLFSRIKLFILLVLHIDSQLQTALVANSFSCVDLPIIASIFPLHQGVSKDLYTSSRSLLVYFHEMLANTESARTFIHPPNHC